MEDLIYKFLIQANYPRSAIVTDVAIVDGVESAADASFVVVDPDTTDRLAVIKVIGPANADLLIEQAALLSHISQAVGGKQVQGFVVRVDTKASREAEQVQFYRCHPNTELQQLSARTFPDMGSLQVHHQLMRPVTPPETQNVSLPEEVDPAVPALGAGLWLPAALLILVATIDMGVRIFSGSSFIDLQHAVLLSAGLVLLSLPALVRYSRALGGDRSESQ